MPQPAHFTERNKKKLQALLHEAILADDMALIRKRLDQGAAPGSFTNSKQGQTALMDAAVAGDPDVVDLFLPFCDIGAVNVDGESALCVFLTRLSCVNNSSPPQRWLETLRKLCPKPPATFSTCSPLSRVASFWGSCAPDVNVVVSELAPFSSFSRIAGYKATPCSIALLHLPPSRSDVALAIFRADPLNAKGKSLRPELYELVHRAANSNRVEFLKEILPMAPIDIRNDFGRTPFLSAAGGVCLDAMELFVAMESEVEAVDNDGCDALMLAIERNSPAMDFERLMALIPTANLFFRDNLGESALDKALDRSMTELAKSIKSRMLGREISPPTLSASLGPPSAKLQQLLFRAIEEDDMALFEKRLAQGANPSSCTKDWPFAPFFLTLALSRNEMIQRLIPLADLSSPNANGQTPLACYLRSTLIHDTESLSIMKMLTSPEAVRAGELLGQPPLACLRADPAILPAALESLASLSDWTHIDVNAFSANPILPLSLWSAHPDQAGLAKQADADGETLAHIAATHNNKTLLFAISPHADFSAKDAQGRTPLMLACSHGYVNDDRASAIFALAPWSDCRAVDHNGCDALMLLMETSYEDDCHAIIDQLAPRSDLFARDFLGESALDKALDRGFADAVMAIRGHLAIHEERANLATFIPPPAQKGAGQKRI